MIEGPTEYVNARCIGCKINMESLGLFQKPPLGGMPNTKLGNHGTPNAHNCCFVPFYHVWGPAWKKFIQIAFGWGLHANIPHSSGSLRVHQTPQRAQVFFKFLLGKLGCNLWKAPLNWDIVYWAGGVLWLLHITRIILLKYFSIWLWGIDNTLQNISHIQIECEEYSIQ